ncbi:MAG TPA: AAA family ATPase [Candidatus Ratteibacteria bacterium]|nr:AAA family ATPase [Candidatus Ratteibacteria bacterium]
MKIIQLKEYKKPKRSEARTPTTTNAVVDVKESDLNLENYIPSVNYIERDFYGDVVQILDKGLTPYLIGESGTGKTAFAEWYASKEKLPLLIVNCDYKNLREMLGQYTLKNGLTGPITEFQLGLLTHCLTNETVVLFDEVNSLEGEYLFFLHELINNRRVFVPEVNTMFYLRGKILLSSNPTGRVYHGTNPLNYALLSRVAMYEVPLWEEKELKKLIKDDEIVRFFLEANKMSREQNLGVYLGIRELTQFQALVGVLGKKKALEVAFLNKVKASADDDTAEAFRGLSLTVLGTEI